MIKNKKIDLSKWEFFCKAEGIAGFGEEINFHAKAMLVKEIANSKGGIRIECCFDLSRDVVNYEDKKTYSKNEGQVNVPGRLVFKEGCFYAKVFNNLIPASPDGDLFDYCGFIENGGKNHVAFTLNWVRC